MDCHTRVIPISFKDILEAIFIFNAAISPCEPHLISSSHIPDVKSLANEHAEPWADNTATHVCHIEQHIKMKMTEHFVKFHLWFILYCTNSLPPPYPKVNKPMLDMIFCHHYSSWCSDTGSVRRRSRSSLVYVMAIIILPSLVQIMFCRLVGQAQAIIWSSVGILMIRPSGTNFNEISIEILPLSFKKMPFKMPSGKWRLCCLGLNVLKQHVCHNGCKELFKSAL